MKGIAKKLVLRMLKSLAKRRMKRFRGKVIGVTGSIGKTSTKEAIYTVLNSRYKVRKNRKSMNSDFGLLLTILDIESGFTSATKWSWYLLKGFWHSLWRDHSEVLLLEMGVDAPGDMDFLLSVVKPDIAVLTGVSYTHLDEGQFASPEAVFAEKRKLIDALKEGGKAVLGTDNDYCRKLAKELKKKRVLSYGTDRDDDFWASQIKQSLEGTDFVLHHDNKRYEVKAPVLGAYQVQVMLPAIICGSLMGIEIEDACEALKRFELPPGRMSVITAMNEAIILDSSYNSSPVALEAALDLLKELGEKHRKVAVLGNMNELGSLAAQLHEKVGEKVPGAVDLLLTVGKNAGLIAEAARAKG
ncbi:UDP-N-acetylmuramoyl-tripeptide--D-alanyl-D-alanine ligase, partial [Candidatus Peregrinibacteria bacterium]|nr:UDP-N-acetylmuramoyl-tripeptide--D-alanyl-D-alanine ligase [Candidatus Peregrinibacteria bacterium]